MRERLHCHSAVTDKDGLHFSQVDPLFANQVMEHLFLAAAILKQSKKVLFLYIFQVEIPFPVKNNVCFENHATSHFLVLFRAVSGSAKLAPMTKHK